MQCIGELAPYAARRFNHCRPFRQLTAHCEIPPKHSARFKPAQARREDDLTTMITFIFFVICLKELIKALATLFAKRRGEEERSSIGSSGYQSEEKVT